MSGQPTHFTQLQVSDRLAKLSLVTAVVGGLVLAGIAHLFHTSPAGRATVIVSIVSIAIPGITAIAFAAQCSAIRVAGLARCRRPRQGLFERCHEKSHRSSIYDLWACIALAAGVLDAVLVIPTVMG